MDGLREPVGGQPPEVYWRRRIVAATGLVLALVVLYFLAFSPDGGKDDAAVSPGAEAPAEGTDDTTTPASDGATGGTSRACTAEDVQLTVTPNPFNVAGGALPVFDVSVKNNSATPCLVDTAAEGTEFTVWSGGESNKDMYFSTAYCPDDATVASRQMLLQSGTEEKLSVTWSRQRVGEGCTTGDAPAAGFYWAQLTVQGIASEPTQFQLSD